MVMIRNKNQLDVIQVTLAMISDELVAGMAITHVRARDVGAQLITNALRALVHI